jgi:hypothetical protein
MRDNWNNLDPENSRGPISYGIKIILILFLLGGAISAIGYGFGWFGEAAQVTQEQFGPRALLEKYEWFKNAAAELDAKSANIDAMQARVTSMDKTYEGVARKDWPRSDREQYNQWENEVAGLKANYNDLAAKYNAAMSKFNYRFTNVGDLPKGATQVLQREYRQYK